jgi:TRAP-type mannitol/chloroaromatic compound transport system permease small subunit
MQFLLSISRGIDWINDKVGKIVYWCILAAVIISATNAVVRYGFNESSNSWLEVQWYLFGAVFLLCAGYTLERNEHIRIDVVSGRLSPKTRNIIDLIGGLFFLLPMAAMIAYMGWLPFSNAYVHHEISGNAGGLVRWPARLLIPVGFFLLALQGVSEVIKRIAVMRGLIPDPHEKKDAHTPPLPLLDGDKP